MMRALISAACVSLCGATDHATPGQPLVQPKQVRLADYPAGFDLTLDVYEFVTSGATFNTRAFDGNIPGPTLIFRRNFTNKANLVNKLTGPDAAYVHNQYGHVSSTNIHTHGLHIPHEQPGDDVKIVIDPKTTFNYAWDIPGDHAPGTHWYHPHLHGSTALQAGGGAHGMLLVEDDASDGVPSWLLNLNETQLIISVVPQVGIASLESMEKAAKGTVVKASGSKNLVLVNGQNKPVITMQKGEWYRWRLVFVSIHHHATLIASGCEFGVLAKDGIYVPGAPRPSSYMKFVSGNRVDVVIRCTANSELAQSNGAAEAQFKSSNGGGKSTAIEDATLATIEVTGADASSGTLASLAFTPKIPTYLTDLRTATVHGSKSIDFSGGGTSGCVVNGQEWLGDGSDHLFTVYESTIEEFTVGAGSHPLHIHVNPVQVQSDADPWNQPGDWMDVVMSKGVYRQHLADHAGTVIVHCHWLSHEDLGCMSQFTIAKCDTDDVANGVLGTCSTMDAGLQVWVIVLIVVGVVLVLGCIGAGVFYWWRRRKAASAGKDAAPPTTFGA